MAYVATELTTATAIGLDMGYRWLMYITGMSNIPPGTVMIYALTRTTSNIFVSDRSQWKTGIPEQYFTDPNIDNQNNFSIN